MPFNTSRKTSWVLSFSLSGVLVLIGIFGHRTQETIRFGKPEPHIAGFIVAAAILAWGIFAAHAGVIFWSRRLLAYLRHRHLQQGRT